MAMDRTISNIKEFAAWYSKYHFIAPGEVPAGALHIHTLALLMSLQPRGKAPWTTSCSSPAKVVACSKQ